MIVAIIGAAIGLGVIGWLISLMTGVFQGGLLEFVNFGLDYMAQLLGSDFNRFFVGFFGIGGLILIARFILSWIGENGGQSANT